MTKQQQSRFTVPFFALFLALAFAVVSSTASYAIPHASGNKRDEFIQFMFEAVQSVNGDIMVERQDLLSLEEHYKKNKELSTEQQQTLKTLANRYEMESFDHTKTDHWKKLKSRIDIIPPSLAIAQAATETGWGNSRYAKVANNYFGHSCFKRGCGLVPYYNTEKIYYEARKFSSVSDSIRSYINNLNTHQAYEKLRNVRYQQRLKDQNPDGIQLAVGLTEYAAAGQRYVKYIQKMIKNYQLNKLDNSTGE